LKNQESKAEERVKIDEYQWKRVARQAVFGAKKKTKGGVLRSGHIDQAKAEPIGKRGRQTMDGHFQCWGGRGVCIASKAFLP
jgi:hypothetical protein